MKEKHGIGIRKLEPQSQVFPHKMSISEYMNTHFLSQKRTTQSRSLTQKARAKQPKQSQRK